MGSCSLAVSHHGIRPAAIASSPVRISLFQPCPNLQTPTVLAPLHPLSHHQDTEFPGVVARPVGNFKSSREYHYRALKINVDMLKLIQLGLTFTDAQGNLPVCNGEHTVWQFNFRGFRLSEDVYAQDSIELLKQSGIDFAQLEVRSHISNQYYYTMS